MLSRKMLCAVCLLFLACGISSSPISNTTGSSPTPTDASGGNSGNVSNSNGGGFSGGMNPAQRATVKFVLKGVQ